jgi:translation initiation factor 1A
MVKNVNGGNKHKKKKNSTCYNIDPNKTIVYKDDSDLQFYAEIQKVFGSGRFEGYCEDGITRNVKLRGKIRKKKTQIGDIVLISLREFQTDDKKADIIHKYTDEEKDLLLQKNYLEPLKNKDSVQTDVQFQNEFPDDIDFEVI